MKQIAAPIVLFLSVVVKAAFLLTVRWLFAENKIWSAVYAGTIAYVIAAGLSWWRGFAFGNPFSKTIDGSAEYGKKRLMMYIRTAVLGAALPILNTGVAYYFTPISVVCLMAWTVPLQDIFSNLYFGRYIPKNTLLLNISIVLSSTSVAVYIDIDVMRSSVEAWVYLVLFILVTVLQGIWNEKAITADRVLWESLFWQSSVAIPMNFVYSGIAFAVNPKIINFNTPFFTSWNLLAALFIGGMATLSLLKYYYMQDTITVSIANVIVSCLVYGVDVAVFGLAVDSFDVNVLFALFIILTVQLALVYKSQMTTYTLVFLMRMGRGDSEDEAKVLLAMQKRGVLKGLFNGYGGKAEGLKDLADTSALLDCAKRELDEESGIQLAPEIDLNLSCITFGAGSVDMIYFYNDKQSEHVPQETAEGKGDWYSVAQARAMDREGKLAPDTIEMINLIYKQINGQASTDMMTLDTQSRGMAKAGHFDEWQRKKFLVPTMNSNILNASRRRSTRRMSVQGLLHSVTSPLLPR